jgi:hypothetical protein
MELSSWPRHQLRAQGRLRGRFPRTSFRQLSSVYDDFVRFHLTEDGISSQAYLAQDRGSNAQFLNYLSYTAATTARDLLENNDLEPVQALPAIEAAKTLTEDKIELRSFSAAHKAHDESSASELADSSLASQSLFTLLADKIVQQAETLVSEPFSNVSFLVEEHQHEHKRHRLGLNNLSNLVPEIVTEPSLDARQGTSHSIHTVSGAKIKTKQELVEEGITRTEFAGPVPNGQAPANHVDKDGKTAKASADDAQTSIVGTSHSLHFYSRRKLLRRVLRSRGKKPSIETLPHGKRLECFDNGATLVKDALGRVIEIKSNLGPVISIHYDSEGYPDTFIRNDEAHEVHSIGERNKRGVVVRDHAGHVRAAGESMAVDPTGCLSVHTFDGQFFSIDLVRGLHIERRRLIDSTGIWYTLTAVFSSDGFRMMTRFQISPDREKRKSANDAYWASMASDGKLRFYGRDGSVIQFESEEELKQLTPSTVWPPGSRHIEPRWRGYYQAGAAWESVQEYISNYLAAVS